MKWNRVASVADPIAATLCAFVLVAMMLTTISLTAQERQLIVFLCGVLAAAVLACVSHSANDRWTIARRTAQLQATREKLAAQTRARSSMEAALAHTGRNDLVDEALPAMLAYVDANGIVRYHNRAYAQWVARADGDIDGRPVEELIGRAVYAEIEGHLKGALAGREIRYERSQSRTGVSSRLFVHYIPHVAPDGQVPGVFALITDISPTGETGLPRRRWTDDAKGAADRLLSALERDEFCLFSQPIAALGKDARDAGLCEVVLRHKEEEDNHLPPGAFLQVAEEQGLLPNLDRWTVSHVLDLAATDSGAHEYLFRVSPATVAEGSFGKHVRGELAARKLRGSILCLAFTEQDVITSPRVYRDLINDLREEGCRFAISGFGGNCASVGLFRQLGVDYLRIDGNLVLNLQRDPEAVAKMKAANDAAHEAGMRVVAECVETDGTRAMLRTIGTDFGQGLGIAAPRRWMAA